MNEKLRSLGLSSYEAKAYLTLLKLDVSDANKIANTIAMEAEIELSKLKKTTRSVNYFWTVAVGTRESHAESEMQFFMPLEKV